MSQRLEAGRTVASRELLGRRALVTGAAGGLGRACAFELAQRGAELMLVDCLSDRLEAVADELAGEGHSARCSVADVTDPDQVDRVVAEAAAAGGFWICVNSAGINRPAPALEQPIADFDAIQQVNVRATYLMCRAAARAFLETGEGGRIVNLSSQMGSVGYADRAAYCASKHAVNGLTKALAIEWARHGITVNAVAPTFVETPLTRPMFENAEFKLDVLRRIPLGRLGAVDEVAAAVGFLASPRAALVTGSVLAIDGGWTAW